MGRMKSWFEDYRTARASFAARKDKEKTKIAKVMGKKKGDVVGYYVGMDHLIEGLKSRYTVEVYDK